MEQFKTIVIRNIIIKAINVILILTIVKSSQDLTKYVIIMAGGQLVSQIVLWSIVLKEIDFIKPKWQDIFPHFKPNILLFLPTIAASVYQMMDKIMIGAISSKAQLAYYEYADKLIQIPLLIFTAMGTVMLSRMSNLSVTAKKSADKLLELSMDLTLVLASACSFGLAAIAEELATVYYGKEFILSGTILFFLSPIIFFNGWANVLRTQYIIPQGKDTVYIKATVAGAVVNLILNAIFIPRYNATGATIGTIVAQIIVAMVFTFYSKNELPLKQYILKNIPYVFCGVVMFIIIKLIQQKHNINIRGLILDVAVGIATYSFCSLLISLKNPDHLLGMIIIQIKK